MEQSEIQEILLQVNPAYDNSAGDTFNIFKTLKVGHYENTHSAIIAEFLSPKSTHGLKETFLELFLDTIKDEKNIINEHFDFECKNASVKTEAYTRDNGRIDILIENNKNQAIIIENKIFAYDQHEQLKRYDNYARGKYDEDNYLILYLTLDGKEASEQSSDNNKVSYIKISYKDDIINWLEKCSSISEKYPLVHATINQYINHIKKITEQDMDTKNYQEIANLLCDSTENVKKAFAIYKSKDAFIKTFAERYVKPLFEKVVAEINNELPLNLELKTDLMDSGSRIMFCIANSSICLRFEPVTSEFKNFYYGLTKDIDVKIYGTQPLNCLQKVNPYWPYGWNYLFDSDKSWWDNESELANEIKEHAMRIFQEMEDRRLML